MTDARDAGTQVAINAFCLVLCSVLPLLLQPGSSNNGFLTKSEFQKYNKHCSSVIESNTDGLEFNSVARITILLRGNI